MQNWNIGGGGVANFLILLGMPDFFLTLGPSHHGYEVNSSC